MDFIEYYLNENKYIGIQKGLYGLADEAMKCDSF